MKKVLVTGANSYIGTSFNNYLKQNSEDIQVNLISLRDGLWRSADFSIYDAVYYVAGIAHIKETKSNAGLYYDVNCKLTLEVAEKAKEEGVKQFIFLSSMSVYGMDKGAITKDTQPSPKSNYGKSKLLAEEGLVQLEDDNFKICIIRPPMIYGKGCKGNYVTLRKLALKLPFFPYVKNSRSMLYIDNLSEFVRLMIINEEGGVFCPQNNEYTNTSEMVKFIANNHGKKIKLVKGFGWIIKLSGLFMRKINKAFGSLTYDKSMSEYKENYIKQNIEASIRETEL